MEHLTLWIAFWIVTLSGGLPTGHRSLSMDDLNIDSLQASLLCVSFFKLNTFTWFVKFGPVANSLSSFVHTGKQFRILYAINSGSKCLFSDLKSSSSLKFNDVLPYISFI